MDGKTVTFVKNFLVIRGNSLASDNMADNIDQFVRDVQQGTFRRIV